MGRTGAYLHGEAASSLRKQLIPHERHQVARMCAVWLIAVVTVIAVGVVAGVLSGLL